MIPRKLRQNRLPLLASLLLGLVLCAPQAGCSLLFPDADVVAPDRDDDAPKPDRKVEDEFKVRKGVAAAIRKDKMQQTDTIVLYGIFSASADFIDGLPENTKLTTTDFGKGPLDKMLTQVGWRRSKYKAIRAEISRCWDAYEFGEAQDLSDEKVREKIIDLYRLTAEGCRDTLAK